MREVCEISSRFVSSFHWRFLVQQTSHLINSSLQNVFPLRIRILNNTEILGGSMSNSNLTVTNHIQSPRSETIFLLHNNHWRSLTSMLSNFHFQIPISVSSRRRDEIPPAECRPEGSCQTHFRWLQHRQSIWDGGKPFSSIYFLAFSVENLYSILSPNRFRC